ncbi:hypothetical protein KVR01_011889 [Diaporthe batatas]|uniref:uncharacterized protein n=1 Tax=Diaporthe batatas TaxID=748121 RepID=UPI001D059AA3|nr:uncharacterized protein KVR01_011889 [Diaporthe batatas]KAG8158128.1 hypothetical protein KVR01_011889 [Diaporthe batatas]
MALTETVTETISAHDVRATFYYMDLTDPSFADPVSFPSDQAERNNIAKLPGNKKPAISLDFVVKDISTELDKYTLDTHGFQYIKHKSKLSKDDFADDEKVRTIYYPESIDLIKRATGASYVHVYEHNSRGPVKPTQNKEIPMQCPCHFVHCDQSYNGAKTIALSRIPDKAFAEKAIQVHFAVMNVWRPVRTIYKDPFACAEGASVVDDTDLAPMPIQADDLLEEGWAVGPNKRHRWYFKYAQQPDEVLLFKNFDSEGPVKRIVHSAFIDPSNVDNYDRESIELRCIVVFNQDASGIGVVDEKESGVGGAGNAQGQVTG